MVDRYERFSFAISEISRCLHRLATDVMEKHGLKGPHAVYFTILYRYEEGLTAVKLASFCARDKADVSRAISIFEEKGLVTKLGNDGNFYRALLVLTEKGRLIAEQINEKARKAVENVSKGITDENRENLYNSLDIISENMRNLSREGL